MTEPQQFGTDIENAINEVSEFAFSDEFGAVMAELLNTPWEERHAFVRDVMIRPAELARRGVQVPDGLTIQRSWFEDDRPTLFCITKYLPHNSTKKVTITFDEGWEHEYFGTEVDELSEETDAPRPAAELER